MDLPWPTVQLILNSHVSVHVYACMFIWCAHALLHAILVSARLPVNTCNTQVMRITSLHLVCYRTRVVYRYNEMPRFCSRLAYNGILPLAKYMGVSLLINAWKCMYNVETSMKSISYVATCSLNHISYFTCWTVVEVDSRQNHFVLLSITWKSYWNGVVLPNMLGYPCVVCE